jgi:arabinose-5-phosphate isomerase
MTDFLTSATQVFNTEIAAIQHIKSTLNATFNQTCQMLLDTPGKVVVIGMGKSGHIGGKIAATLASTGTPAFFVHPGEASHGDLGMITEQDTVIAISNSGQTEEVLGLIPVLKRRQIRLISMTGNKDSLLAKSSDIHLNIDIPQEACPFNLAPTASTTATLVMGDAIAVALLTAKGFTEEDFALSHPGGALGKRLLLRVCDIMHQGDKIPMVLDSVQVKEALIEITSKRLGMTCVVDKNQKLVGVFTDGDLRRLLNQNDQISRMKITEVMTKSPQTIKANILAVEALAVIEDTKINQLIVTDSNNHPIGALNMHDLLQAGVV